MSLAPSVPAFLASAARGAEPDRNGRILVVLELAGGNDGLNTVVPFRDDAYARGRPTLRLSGDQVVKLTDSLGLNPAMRGMGRLWEDGALAIVQGVGYPNPNRSHFESLAIWHTASPESAARGSLGWIGRGLDGGRIPADGGAFSTFGRRWAIAGGSPRSAIGRLQPGCDRGVSPHERGGGSPPAHDSLALATSPRLCAAARSTPMPRQIAWLRWHRTGARIRRIPTPVWPLAFGSSPA